MQEVCGSVKRRIGFMHVNCDKSGQETSSLGCNVRFFFFFFSPLPRSWVAMRGKTRRNCIVILVPVVHAVRPENFLLDNLTTHDQANEEVGKSEQKRMPHQLFSAQNNQTQKRGRKK